MTEQSNFDYQDFLKNTPNQPGVYVMKNDKDAILYIGKAKNLKNRLSSYFHKNQLSTKTLTLVGQIHHIDLNITSNELEALILEYNLINKYKPKYNILLKDGKDFIYINVSNDAFPKISYQHGIKNKKIKSFGPYPSGFSAKQSVMHLQKIFKIRDCSNSYFANRTRPCLQYQIDKCSGSCVGKITQENYAEDVKLCEALLRGKNETVMQQLAEKMELASVDYKFEVAAKYRDQIATLRVINEKQYVSKTSGDVDIIAIYKEAGIFCISVCYIRKGKNLGFRQFFPKSNIDEEEATILDAFLTRYYMRHPAPKEIVLQKLSQDNDLLLELIKKESDKKVKFIVPHKGERKNWLSMAYENAVSELKRMLISKSSQKARMVSLQQLLKVDKLPQRIECFDISHTFGEATVASCVVFDVEGAKKSDYRRFNISGIEPGDDYAAIKQALMRRYKKLVDTEAKLPDVLLVDGGKGQVTQAREVLTELGILSKMMLVGVAKGPERISGEEDLIVEGWDQTIQCDKHNPGFHLIQQIRDEAHRFAITGHRGQRAKKRKESLLQSIRGLGPKRRKSLLTHFGGLQGVAKARVEELNKVEGINTVLAQLIYQKFHSEKQINEN